MSNDLESAEGKVVENGQISIAYFGEDAEKGAEFNITDLTSGSSKNMYVDLRYWSSCEGLVSPSGAYIFRPRVGQTDSFKYSKL